MKSPSDLSHTEGTAAGTDANIVVPGKTHHIREGKSGKTRTELPASLKIKDDAKITLFDPACKKTEVTDLLKAMREDMEHEPSDEFAAGDGDILRLTGTVVFRRKSHVRSGNGFDA